MQISIDLSLTGSILGQNEGFEIPIFYSDFSTESIDAIISKGSGTGTFLVSRGVSNPATYIDSNGIMQKTEVSNTPRFTGKYYDSLGLQDYNAIGLLMESQQTNFLIHSIFDIDTNVDGLADGWGIAKTVGGSPTNSLVDVISLFNVGVNVHAQRVQYVGGVGDNGQINLRSDNTAIGSFSQNDKVTVSLFIKGSQTGISYVGLSLVERDAGGVVGTIHSSGNIRDSISNTEFRKFSFSTSCVDSDCSRLNFDLEIEGVQEGDTFDYQIACVQVEKNGYATSFIPTTTVSLTRNVEQLSYSIVDNRSATIESMIIKVAPLFPNGIISLPKIISTTTLKRRECFFKQNTNTVSFFANLDDSVSSVVDDVISNSWVANTAMTLGYNMQQTSPYIKGYYQGINSGTNEITDNYITPAWNTPFYVGSALSVDNTLNGIIFEIAFFDKLLTDAQHNIGHLNKLNAISA